jgi:hypothetical protein
MELSRKGFGVKALRYPPIYRGEAEEAEAPGLEPGDKARASRVSPTTLIPSSNNSSSSPC